MDSPAQAPPPTAAAASPALDAQTPNPAAAAATVTLATEADDLSHAAAASRPCTPSPTDCLGGVPTLAPPQEDLRCHGRRLPPGNGRQSRTGGPPRPPRKSHRPADDRPTELRAGTQQVRQTPPHQGHERHEMIDPSRTLSPSPHNPLGKGKEQKTK